MDTPQHNHKGMATLTSLQFSSTTPMTPAGSSLQSNPPLSVANPHFFLFGDVHVLPVLLVDS